MHSKFHAAAVSPQGSSVTKTGVDRAEATLRHDDADVQIQVTGSLVEGAPSALIRASSRTQGPGVEETVFFDGPLSEIFATSSLRQASRALIQAYYYGELEELAAAAERLRSLLGWKSFAAEDPDTCDCGGLGWAIFNDNPELGYLGEVQACDSCRQVPDDDAAAQLARSLGFVVSLRDRRYVVEALPAPSHDPG